MTPPADPIQTLPRPSQVHQHIGRLLRELRIARRLLRLSQAADAQNVTPKAVTPTPVVTPQAR